MKKSRGIIISVLMIFMLALAACSKTPDGALGEYVFVVENGPIFTKENVDSKMILDGYGSGEYHKKDYVHKIKYTYESPNIEISDSITGIKYNGTLINGELHLYDGDPNSMTVSEFFFQKKSAY